MGRRLLRILSVLSLLLCLASVGLWVGSWWYGGWITHGGEGRIHQGGVHQSRLFYDCLNFGSTRTGWRAELYPPSDPFTLDAPRVSFAGFGYDRMGGEAWQVTVPLWFPTLLSGVVCLACLRWLHRRRFAPGQCRQCGYDLRAHTCGQRCPECGTMIAAVKV